MHGFLGEEACGITVCETDSAVCCVNVCVIDVLLTCFYEGSHAPVENVPVTHLLPTLAKRSCLLLEENNWIYSTIKDDPFLQGYLFTYF